MNAFVETHITIVVPAVLAVISLIAFAVDRLVARKQPLFSSWPARAQIRHHRVWIGAGSAIAATALLLFYVTVRNG